MEPMIEQLARGTARHYTGGPTAAVAVDTTVRPVSALIEEVHSQADALAKLVAAFEDRLAGVTHSHPKSERPISLADSGELDGSSAVVRALAELRGKLASSIGHGYEILEALDV